MKWLTLLYCCVRHPLSVAWLYAEVQRERIEAEALGETEVEAETEAEATIAKIRRTHPEVFDPRVTRPASERRRGL